MNIGRVIFNIRKEKKISQGWLALKIGVTQTSMSLIENGKKRPSEKHLKKICKALDVHEAMLHLLSLEDSDIPKSKKEVYNAYFPFIKDMLLKILTK